jgi:hypothetical protein
MNTPKFLGKGSPPTCALMGQDFAQSVTQWLSMLSGGLGKESKWLTDCENSLGSSLWGW